jgi:hypothetical protein
MVRPRPFDVLFLTNFSDSCFRAIPALAQLGDDIDMRLTIVHAIGSGADDRGQLEPKIRSFFPEADLYTSCRRMLVPGTPLDAVRHIRSERPVDLVVAPAGDPLGLPRVGHTSLRARLVRESGAPVLTLGRGAMAGRLVRPTRTVTCCIEMGSSARAHLRLAGEYARTLGATLHVVQVLPDIDDGSLVMLADAEPFTEDYVTRQLRRAGACLPDEIVLHSSTRDRLPRLLTQCNADVAFLDGTRWMHRRWFTARMSSIVDALPCPAVCVDGAYDDLEWHLPRNPARAARAAFAFDLVPGTTVAVAVAH